MVSKAKVLFKYPTRGRPTRFFEGMDSIVDNMYDQQNYHISVTADDDDDEMNRPDVIERIKAYPNTSIAWGTSISKINAVNRSIPEYPWDIIFVMSDDVRLTFFGIDEIIRQEFLDGDYDKLLHVMDQDAKHHLAVIYIAGRKYYDRFGFIYNNEYFSLFCDNEAMEIAQQLGKYKLCTTPGLLVHLNAAYGHMEKDLMFLQQQEIGWSVDQATYLRRKAKNFDL